MMKAAAFETHNLSINTCRLTGEFAAEGFDRWRHTFTGYSLNTGKPRKFFVEYFLCNPASGSQKPVFSSLSSGVHPSFLMIKAGSWGENGAQLHKFYGWRKIEIDYGKPFSISAGECFISEDGIRGLVEVNPEEAVFRKELMSDAGFMSWSLTIEKHLSFGDGEGWHAEGMRSSYTGEIIWNGERYSVRPKDCNGFADKNWGRSFPREWLVLSSGRLKRQDSGKFLKNSAFATGGSPDSVSTALSAVGLKAVFRPSFLCRTDCRCRESQRLIIWHIEQKKPFLRIEIDITCRKRDMLLTRYDNTSGSRSHSRIWTGGDGNGSIKCWRFGKLVADLKTEGVTCGLTCKL